MLLLVSGAKKEIILLIAENRFCLLESLKRMKENQIKSVEDEKDLEMFALDNKFN